MFQLLGLMLFLGLLIGPTEEPVFSLGMLPGLYQYRCTCVLIDFMELPNMYQLCSLIVSCNLTINRLVELPLSIMLVSKITCDNISSHLSNIALILQATDTEEDFLLGFDVHSDGDGNRHVFFSFYFSFLFPFIFLSISMFCCWS